MSLILLNEEMLSVALWSMLLALGPEVGVLVVTAHGLCVKQ